MTALDHPWIGAVGWALVHFLWQGLLLWLGVALSLRVLGRAKPSTRYAVTSAGLLLCLALPLFGILRNLPASPIPEDSPTISTLAFQATSSQVPLSALPRGGSLERVLEDRLPVIVLLWALGAGLLSLRFASGLAWVRNLRQREVLPYFEAWQRRLDRLSRALGLERRVLLRVIRGIESPLAAGIWRPVIFLPASIATGMPPDLVEALLAHELAHILRHDYLMNLVQSSIEVLLFYHPAVWWISGRIRIEREQICDELAAGALGEPRRLALALQELDLLQLATPHLAQGAHGGNLMTRIRRIIHPEPRPLAWKALASILGLTVACVASAAISSPLLQKAPEPPAPPQAPPAPPRPPEPPRPPRPERPEMTYAFVRSDGKGMSCSASTSEQHEVQALKKRLKGDFLWFRDKDHSYVIEDPAEIAKLRELFKPMDELRQRMDELGQEMKVHGDKLKALGQEMKAVSKHDEPHSKEMGTLGRQMGALGREAGELGKRQVALERKLDNEKLSAADERALEAQMEQVEKQIEALDAQMEELGRTLEAHGQKLEEAHQPMKAIGQKMDAAGKPMEEVGQRMEAAGAQMEREGEKIEAALRKLMKESLANGKAAPAKS